MTHWGIVFLFSFSLSVPFVATGQANPTIQQRLETLARKMHLKTPKLAEGDYEIRIWNRQGLMFGDAQMLYVLTKKKESLSAYKYVINSDKNGFKGAARLEPTTPVTTDFWEQLLKEDILTLPDEEAISQQLHPRQKKDSTWVSVESDGSVSVHAKKIESSVWITDGESYHFEVFSADDYRIYSYSNPRGYIRHKPDIAELQNVVAILDEMKPLFSPTN